MFCSECGTKCEKGSAFCGNCGTKLAETKKTNKSNKKNNTVNKNNKTIIIVVAVLIVLGVCYAIGKNITDPKNVAQKYIQAVVNSDGNTLYGFLDLEGDKTFVSKSVFEKAIKNMNKDTNIVNFKITKVEYGTGKISAKVNFTYTTKNSNSEQSNYVNLIKQKSKKYLVFDNWKVGQLINGNMIVKNYAIKTLKDSKVEFAGVKVSNKYIDKEKSTDAYDVYVLPQVFSTKNSIKVTLPNGLEIENEVTPSSYNNEYKVNFNKNSLTDEAKDSLLNTVKGMINDIYTNAIAGKSFSDVKPSYEVKGLSLSDLESSYTDLVDRLKDSSTKLTSITLKSVSLYDMYLTDKGYLKVQVKVNYDYTVEYSSNEEVKTSDNSDYDYMTVTLGMKDSKYYLVDFYGLKYYFYR